jgi:sorbitol-6-phosphate 2-dehydrogenase
MNMEKVLQDKVVLITGGAQGLGEVLCHRMAIEGADVIVADLNLAGAERVASEIADKTGRKTLAVGVDVTREDQVEEMFAKIVKEFGRLDILISNAGILISGGIEDFPSQKWQAVINVNLVGYFHCAKHAAILMMKQRSGVIIQVNSKSGKKGSFKNSAYAASKFGGIGLTQSLALELAGYGVRVNAVCPGNLLDSPLWVDSLYEQYAHNQGITKEQVREKYIGQVPLGRGCTYEDVGNVIVFLASEQANYMTGQAINVTGGQEMR